MNTMTPAILTIPLEVLEAIGVLLPAHCIVKLSCTCRTLFHQLAYSLHCKAIAQVGGIPALHFAIWQNNVSLARYLLTFNPALIHLLHSGQTPLHTAVAPRVLPRDRYPNPNPTTSAPVSLNSLLSITGNELMVSRPPGSPCPWPAYVIHRPTIRMLELLLDSGPEINARDCDLATPLHQMCSNGWAEPIHVDMLIAHGADVHMLDRNGETPLALAVDNRDIELVTALLQHGADPNTCDRSKEPLVCSAAESNHPRLLGALLAAGADPERRGCRLQTPIMSAAVRGSLECIDVLIAAGVNLGVDFHSVPCVFGVMSLVEAAVRSRTPSVALRLIAAGAVCNVPDRRGVMPLVWAVRRRSVEMVSEMLKVRYESEGGIGEVLVEALRVAEENDSEEVVNLLKEEMVRRGVELGDSNQESGTVHGVTGE